MSRYIDADALIEEINSLSVTLCGRELFGELAKHSVVQKINEAPTADVVEVVRCKDCKYYKLWDGIQYGRRTVKECCRGIHRKVNEDDYCSYGERRGGTE